MNRNKMLTWLVLVAGISLSIVGQSSSELITSASAQATMGSGTDANTTAQENMTAGAANMTNSSDIGSGNISGCGTECF
jgi:hypothetical protein